jgi:hypothetical protein
MVSGLIYRIKPVPVMYIREDLQQYSGTLRRRSLQRKYGQEQTE